MSKYQSLIDALLALWDGSGKVDDLIYEVMYGYRRASACLVEGGISSERFWLTGAPENVIGGQIVIGNSPGFTFNIEHARKLLLSGWRFKIEGPASPYQTNKRGACEVWCDEAYAFDEFSKTARFSSAAATPAIALCIAAVELRLAMTKAGEAA